MALFHTLTEIKPLYIDSVDCVKYQCIIKIYFSI